MMYQHYNYMLKEHDYAYVSVGGSYDLRTFIYRKDLSDQEKEIYDKYTTFVNEFGGKIVDISDIELPADFFVDIYGDFTLCESHTTDENFKQVVTVSILNDAHKNAIIDFCQLAISKKQ